MSSTGRSDVRVANDVYPTPAWCVDRLLEAVALPGGQWLEPAAGDGAIIRAVARSREDIVWTGLELRALCEPTLLATGAAVQIADALTLDWREFTPKVVITNPPYLLAEAFLERALETDAIIVLLLRLDFLGSDRRSPIFHLMPPDLYVLPNRPSFVGRGTDSTEYGWFIWEPSRARSFGRLQVLSTTPREVRYPKLARVKAEARHAEP